MYIFLTQIRTETIYETDQPKVVRLLSRQCVHMCVHSAYMRTMCYEEQKQHETDQSKVVRPLSWQCIHMCALCTMY